MIVGEEACASMIIFRHLSNDPPPHTHDHAVAAASDFNGSFVDNMSTQIRFNGRNLNSSVSVNPNLPFIGKGYGRTILRSNAYDCRFYVFRRTFYVEDGILR